MIFRKFERVKNPNIPRTRSSGLGLAFCKLVVDAHGGRIWVQSAGEGKGSAFHFSLPTKPRASRGARHGERSGAGVKVYLRTFGCRANHYDTEAVRAMCRGERSRDRVVAGRRGRRRVQQLRGDVRRRGRAAEGRSSRGARASGAAERRDGLRRGARRAARPVRFAFARCRPSSDVIGGADLAGDRRGARISRCRRAAFTRCADGDARAAAHSGRLRRALHLLRDDDGARREPQPADRRARARGDGAGGASCGNRDHRNSHRHVRRATSASSLGALMTRLVARRAGDALSAVVDRGDGDRRRALVDLLVGAPRRLAPHIHAPLQSGSDRAAAADGSELVYK